MNIQNIHVRATELYVQSFAEFGVGFQPPALTIAQVRAVLAVVAELEPSPVAQPTAPQPAPTEAPKKRRGRPRGRTNSPEHMARIRAAKMAKRLERMQQAATSAPTPTEAATAATDEPEGES